MLKDERESTHIFMKFIFSVFIRGAATLISLAFMIILTRSISQPEVGEYLAGMTLMMGIVTILKFGFDTYIIKLSSPNPHNAVQICYTLICLSLLFFVIGSSIYILVYVTGFYRLSLTNTYFCISSIFLVVLYIISGYFKATSSNYVANFIEVGLVPLVLSLLFIFYKERLDVLSASKLYLEGISMITLFLCLLVLIKDGLPHSWRIDLSRNHFRECLRIMLVNTLEFICVWTPSIIILVFIITSESTLITTREFAIYQISMRISLLIPFSMVVMNSIIAPHISRLISSGDLQELSNRLQVCSTLLMVTILFPCIFIFFFPDVVVGIFGDEYLGYTSALVILVLGQIVNVCAGSVGYVLMMSGNSSVYLKNTLGGWLFCLVLSLLLIPKFGLTGGAIAYVGALVIRKIPSAIFIFRRFRVRTTPSIYGLKMILNKRGLGHALE